MSATERTMPIGVVSHSYSLAAHSEVAALCRQGLLSTGIDPSKLRYEIGLSELGEWMNFRIYLDAAYNFKDSLDIASIPERIRPVFEAVEADRARMEQWQRDQVSFDGIISWIDTKLSEAWGKRAAARVFHICECGNDVDIEDFAPGLATEKPVGRVLKPVPGSPAPARTKYHVSQALSFVATFRNNAEERVSRQMEIPSLLSHLSTQAADHVNSASAMTP